MMKSNYDLILEMKEFSEENKKEAGRIVRSFAEKGLTMRDAREVLKSCKLMLKYSVKIGILDNNALSKDETVLFKTLQQEKAKY